MYKRFTFITSLLNQFIIHKKHSNLKAYKFSLFTPLWHFNFYRQSWQFIVFSNKGIFVFLSIILHKSALKFYMLLRIKGAFFLKTYIIRIRKVSWHSIPDSRPHFKFQVTKTALSLSNFLNQFFRNINKHPPYYEPSYIDFLRYHFFSKWQIFPLDCFFNQKNVKE